MLADGLSRRVEGVATTTEVLLTIIPKAEDRIKRTFGDNLRIIINILNENIRMLIRKGILEAH